MNLKELQYAAEIAHHEALAAQGNAATALARLSVALLTEKQARGMNPTATLDPFDMPAPAEPAPPAPKPAPIDPTQPRGDWFDSEPFTKND